MSYNIVTSINGLVASKQSPVKKLG